MKFFGWRQRKDEDLNEEIQSYLELSADERMARGETEEQARLNARRAFGNVGLVKEDTREVWGWASLERLMQDLRFGLRMLRKQPVFALIAILTLALGIGANTAIFSVVNALVLNPLPYPEPQRLMWVTSAFRGEELIGADLYLTFQAQAQTIEHLAAYRAGVNTWEAKDASERFNVVNATASVFSALGVAPQLGRAFTPEEDRPGAPHVAVISHEYWQRRYGGNPAILGQTVLFNKEQWTIIGVMPPGFRFLPEQRIGGKVDVIVPYALDVQRELQGPQVSIIEGGVFGRLRNGVSREQAQAELEVIFQRYVKERPQMPAGPEVEIKVTPLADRLVGYLRRGLLVLFGSVGLVLLIACANVANLLLARASVRQKELAIRAAVGAGRKRLIRQMLTESLLLSVLGGAAGFCLAWWGVKALVAFTPENLLLLKLSRIDGTALGFTFLATLLTGLTAGVIPALQASRVDLNETLKDGARSVRFFKRTSTASALVIGELALTLVVLVGAGLLVKSFARMLAVDPGFNAQHLLTLGVHLNYEKYPPDSPQRKQFNQNLQARFSALPGVQAAANTEALPLWESGIPNKRPLTVVGQPLVPEAQRPLAEDHAVSPAYFRALQTPLRAGREFTEQDTENTPPVIVINEKLARRLFGDASALGQRLRIEYYPKEMTIIGVVADVKQYGLEAETQAAFYRSSWQSADASGGVWAIRTTGDPLALVPALRQQVQTLNADAQFLLANTMEQRLADSYAPRRFQTWLFGIFAVVALALAAIGVYGVVSYSVSRRTHEIGIRMALGARARDVLRLVIRQGLAMSLIGVALGLVAAYALTRLMASLLFNVTPTDPVTFTVISLLLIGIASLAAYLPARRATKVDPLVALRRE